MPLKALDWQFCILLKKKVTIRLERLIFFIPVDPLKMRTSVTSSYPYFLYVLDEIPMSTYFFHFHKGHSTIYTSRAFLQVEKISSLFLNSSASK